MSIMYEELRRNQEMDSSNIIHSKQHYHQQHNSGLLMRDNSAPISLLTSLIDNNTQSYLNNEESFTSESSNSEMDTMFSKLISSNNGWNNSEEPLQEFDVKPVKQEIGESVPQNGDYSYGGSELIYQGFSNGSSNGFYGSFDGVNSKIGVRNSSSNLIRQKSSPAGFFSNENVEDLATLRELGSFKANEVSGTLNFSSRPRMPQIAENGVQSIEANCDQTTNLVNENGNSKCHIPSFTNEFWDNSAFNAQKTEIEDEIMFSTSNGMESQEAEFCYQNLGLTHHLSLPSSSTKISSSMEKFLQVQGSVPCKIRAKRGFATHPRSIAERVRRMRISERIKKLESLFPKSDKQTSTADMLDLAVEYIKDLQEQVQILTVRKEKCKCTSHEKQHSRQCS